MEDEELRPEEYPDEADAEESLDRFEPMFQRSTVRWVALLIVVSMLAVAGLAGLRIILQWLGL